MSRSKFYTSTIALIALLSFGGFAYADSKAAERHMARGAAAMEEAKSPADYRDAVKEFSKAVKQAPNWADAWFNLGTAQASAKQYKSAIKSFKTYLKKSPKASDRKAVQARIYKLEYKMEKAQKLADKPKFPTPEDLTGYWRTSMSSDPAKVTASGDWLLFDSFENARFTSGGTFIKFRLTGYSLENGSKGSFGLRRPPGTSSGPPEFSCLEKLRREGGMESRTASVTGTINRDFSKIIFRYTDLAHLPGCRLGNHEFEVEYYR